MHRRLVGRGALADRAEQPYFIDTFLIATFWRLCGHMDEIVGDVGQCNFHGMSALFALLSQSARKSDGYLVIIRK